MTLTRIKLISRSKESVTNVSKQIVEIAKSIGIKYRGPVPLPTKRMVIATRKTPCGDGSDTYDHWEMRIYKRLVEIEGSDQALRQVMRIPVPDSVQIEVTIS
ncbi:MAG: 30S ribosomal protein S10 [Candidatus Micrarchaeaceae archaeon]